MAHFTTLERIRTTFEHQVPDRVPIFVNALRSQPAIEYITGRQLDSDPLRVTAEAVRALPIDLLNALQLPTPVPTAQLLDGLLWYQSGYRRWVKERPFGDPAGALAWARHWLAVGEGQAVADAERYLETYAREQALLGPNTVLMVNVPSFLAGVHEPLGLECFSYLMHDEPAALEALIEERFRYTLRFTHTIAQARPGPVVRCAEDLGAKGSPLFSPTWLRRTFFPRLTALVQVVHESGLFFELHSCGNVAALLDDLVATGIDGLDPLEPTSGMSLASTKLHYGQQLAILGNADLNIVYSGSEEAVRSEVRRCIDEGAGGGGYFLHAIGGFDEAPGRNVVAFFDEASRYGCY